MKWTGWKYVILVVKVGSLAFTVYEIFKLFKNENS